MKAPKSLFIIVCLSTIGSIGLFHVAARCQQPKRAAPRSEPPHIAWDGQFGYSKTTPNVVYCLMASGFILDPTSPNFKPLISSWLAKHPKAKVVKVNVFGPLMVHQPDSEQVYVWVSDGVDNLNEYLVRQGGCPGGTMLIPDTSNYPVEARRSSHSKLLVSQQEYTQFIKTITKAESDAQKAKRGIWKNGTDIY